MTWQTGAILAAADLEVDPANFRRVLATTRDGLQECSDGGITFSASGNQPSRLLVMVDHVPGSNGAGVALAGVDPDGVSGNRPAWDGARPVPSPGRHRPFTVLPDGRYAATTRRGAHVGRRGPHLARYRADGELMAGLGCGGHGKQGVGEHRQQRPASP